MQYTPRVGYRVDHISVSNDKQTSIVGKPYSPILRTLVDEDVCMYNYKPLVN